MTKQQRERDIRRCKRPFPSTSQVSITTPNEGRKYPIHVLQDNGLEFDYVADFETRTGWLMLIPQYADDDCMDAAGAGIVDRVVKR